MMADNTVLFIDQYLIKEYCKEFYTLMSIIFQYYY